MTFDTIDAQKRNRRWVESRLGATAMNLHERGMRSAEENSELVQCCGVTEEDYISIVRHVYAKPVGDIQQELGGAGMTLLGVADSAGYVLSQCVDKELERVESMPHERFRKRQSENAAKGIGAPGEFV